MIALLRRLPLRSVLRHPGRALLVIAASLLGTAMCGLPAIPVGPNEAVITSELARALQVDAGAFVQLGADARRVPLRVSRVVDGGGIAALSTDGRASARNVLVSPDTLAALDVRP